MNEKAKFTESQTEKDNFAQELRGRKCGDGFNFCCDTLRYSNHDDLTSRLEALVEQYPNLLSMYQLTEKSHEGRELWVVRISTDGGSTWELLTAEDDPYDFKYGNGWIFNNPEYDCSGSLDHLASGWGGQTFYFALLLLILSVRIRWIGRWS